MKGRRLFTAIAGAAVASSVAGIAYATIPDQQKVYSACMLKGVGTMRLIDKSLPTTNLMSRCTDKEIEISWNQAGQAGVPGPEGPKGDTGDPGRGLSSLEDLAGVPCRTQNFDGVVEVSSAPVSVRSASISLRCVIPNAATLTVQLEDQSEVLASAGRVTGGPVNCELLQTSGHRTCVYVVPIGAVLTLTATPLSPDERFETTFAGWLANGGDCLTREPCTFTVAGDRTIVAQFVAQSR